MDDGLPSWMQMLQFWSGLITGTGGVMLWSQWQHTGSLVMWTTGTVALAAGFLLMHISRFFSDFSQDMEGKDEPPQL